MANFTNVAATFHGIIRAIREYQEALKAHSVQIYVRRGGPNYQEGLRAMQKLGKVFIYLGRLLVCAWKLVALVSHSRSRDVSTNLVNKASSGRKQNPIDCMVNCKVRPWTVMSVQCANNAWAYYFNAPQGPRGCLHEYLMPTDHLCKHIFQEARRLR